MNLPNSVLDQIAEAAQRCATRLRDESDELEATAVRMEYITGRVATSWRNLTDMSTVLMENGRPAPVIPPRDGIMAGDLDRARHANAAATTPTREDVERILGNKATNG